MGRATIRESASVRPQNLTNTLWAYATLLVRDTPLLTAISRASRANIEGELSSWDQGLWETAEPWVQDAILERRRRRETEGPLRAEDEESNAITTAMLWAFWNLSRTPARIRPLQRGPLSLLGIFSAAREYTESSTRPAVSAR